MALPWAILTAAMLVLGVVGDVVAERIDDTPGAIVFLNRHGGVYRPGPDNAVTNTSPILRRSGAVPPFAGSDGDWQEILQRVRTRYAPFDVAVVDVEPPATTRYIEAVVGGRPQALGFDPGVLGIAPVYCRPAATAIVFVFSDLIPGDNDEIAAVVEHEVGHAFSLDHEVLCKSPMSYLTGCGEKTFQNRTSACGEIAERPCFCGAPRQNAFAILGDAFGQRDGPVRPRPAHAESPAPEPEGTCTIHAPAAD